MARIFPICSSSGGNCTFIGTKGHGILVDVGCSFLSLKNALSFIETDMKGIEAVFVTHEHIDHIKGIAQLAKHTDIPIFASAGTIKALRSLAKNPVPETARLYDIFRDGYHSADFLVRAFHTPHDTPESVGYVIEYGGNSIAVCTDLGTVTDEVESSVTGCSAVLLESNYDAGMLARNLNYPADLKRRIASEKGHLSNDSAAEFACRLARGGTRRFILGHLSRENNTPNTAHSRVCSELEKHGFKRERDFTLDVAPIVTDGQYIAL